MDAIAATIEHLPHLGEILALASAVVWAVAVILFRISGKDVHPIGLNLFKNLFALLLLLAVMPVLHKPLFPDATLTQTGLLLLSGFLGIAVSDTLFFMSLNILGASLAAIVDCFYSPFVIILSYAFLSERLNGWQLSGVLLIITAVLTIARKSRGEDERISRKDLIRGIILGVLAMLFVAVGIVLVKPMLAGVGIFWATGVRLVGGTLGVLAFLLLHPKRREVLRPLFDLSNWKAMVPASFLGSFLSLLFWMGGMKFAFASVAAILNQMNTIFIFILATIFLKEKATPWKIVAVFLAFIGAFLASYPF
jgi:drug/metabolite transporter (DMT)-like permease